MGPPIRRPAGGGRASCDWPSGHSRLAPLPASGRPLARGPRLGSGVGAAPFAAGFASCVVRRVCLRSGGCLHLHSSCQRCGSPRLLRLQHRGWHEAQWPCRYLRHCQVWHLAGCCSAGSLGLLASLRCYVAFILWACTVYKALRVAASWLLASSCAAQLACVACLFARHLYLIRDHDMSRFPSSRLRSQMGSRDQNVRSDQQIFPCTKIASYA